MFKKIVVILVILCISGLLVSQPLEDRLKDFAGDNAKGFLQPLANSLGAGINSGQYVTADVLKPLRFNVRLGTTAVFIPSADRTFMASSPSSLLYVEDEIETGTIFGKKKGTFTGNKYTFGDREYKYSDLTLKSGDNIPFIPLPQASVSVGIPFGIEVMGRFSPSITIHEDFGSFSFWGAGLKYDVDQHIPFSGILPVNIALQGVYQNLKVGDLIDITAWNVNAIGSLDVLILTLYGGFGYENATLSIKYEQEILTPNPIPGEEEPIRTPVDVSLDFDAQNDFKFILGTKITIFPFTSFYADYSFATTKAESISNTVNVGLSIGF